MSDAFDDELDPEERGLAERLSAERPVPSAGFRGTLGRHLVARDPGYGPRPAALERLVSAYIILGAVLMALGSALAVGWI